MGDENNEFVFENSVCRVKYIILRLTPGVNGLGKDNCKTRLETFKIGEIVRIMLDIWRHTWSRYD